ncbi:MAG: hypothetical protein U0T75_00535 [Chitinophagales bacterium]
MQLLFLPLLAGDAALIIITGSYNTNKGRKRATHTLLSPKIFGTRSYADTQLQFLRQIVFICMLFKRIGLGYPHLLVHACALFGLCTSYTIFYMSDFCDKSDKKGVFIQRRKQEAV